MKNFLEEDFDDNDMVDIAHGKAENPIGDEDLDDLDDDFDSTDTGFEGEGDGNNDVGGGDLV